MEKMKYKKPSLTKYGDIKKVTGVTTVTQQSPSKKNCFFGICGGTTNKPWNC